MTKIGIIAGFLGAGKTTLLKKILTEALSEEKVCVIENEFGEANYDAVRLKNTATQIYSLSGGCVCCTLVQDLRTTIGELKKTFDPSYIFIEASGVADLKQVIRAVERADTESTERPFSIAVVDAQVCVDLMENLGDFYRNTVKEADCVVLNRIEQCSKSEEEECMEKIKECRGGAPVIFGELSEISAAQVLQTAESGSRNEKDILESMFVPITSSKRGMMFSSGDYNNGMFEKVSVKINDKTDVESLKNCLYNMKSNGKLGKIYRAKGTVKCGETYYQVDLTVSDVSVVPSSDEGESSICVIGKDLNRPEIEKIFS